MDKVAVLALIFVLAIPSSRAYAFESGSDDPGSHMESLRSALADLYGLDLRAPEKTKSSFRWETYRATDLMSEASSDADWYFFGEQAAHAQTKEFDYGKKRGPESLKAIESRALHDYIEFLDRWMKKARAAFNAGDGAKGLYYLGFVCHSYQDLWAHRGITNGMHKSLKKHMGLDVDSNPSRIEEMRARLADWLTAMPDMLGSDSSRVYLDLILSNPQTARPSLAARAKLLGRRRDVFWEGAMYALFQGDSAKCLEYLQDIEWDAEALSAILLDPEAFALAAAMETPEQTAIFLESRGYRF